MQDKQADTPSVAQPLVSFIVPLYNVPPMMLRQSIESIMTLTLRPYEREIIVIDDGSDDTPLAAMGDLRDDIVYVRQTNRGVSVARNRGMLMAQGRFIQFVDADDMLIQAPYEHVLDLVRYGNTDLVMFDFNDTPISDLTYNDKGPMSGTEMMRTSNIHGSAWSYIFKRSTAGSLQFTPGIAYSEDEEFTAQLVLRAESAYATDAKAYCYRQRPQSAINSSDMRSRLKRLNDEKRVIANLGRMADTLPTDERVAMQRRTAQMTMDYIYNVIVLTQSRHYLNRRLEELKRCGLFPLPDRNYTLKYKWFRRMTNSDMGISILMKTLPRMKRER